MNTLTDTAIGFPKLMGTIYPHVRILTTKFLSIDENENVKINSYPFELEQAKIVIVICHYRYLVKTCDDHSFFVLFLDHNGWKDDFYVSDGWKIEFDAPYTTERRTDQRKCTITRGNLKTSIIFKNVTGIEEVFAKAWTYISEMKKCSTQRELECIVKAYNMDIEIDKLRKSNLEVQYSQMVTYEHMQAYKAILDKIGELVNQRN